jgi:hypothetical protein
MHAAPGSRRRFAQTRCRPAQPEQRPHHLTLPAAGPHRVGYRPHTLDAVSTTASGPALRAIAPARAGARVSPPHRSEADHHRPGGPGSPDITPSVADCDGCDGSCGVSPPHMDRCAASCRQADIRPEIPGGYPPTGEVYGPSERTPVGQSAADLTEIFRIQRHTTLRWRPNGETPGPKAEGADSSCNSNRGCFRENPRLEGNRHERRIPR